MVITYTSYMRMRIAVMGDENNNMFTMMIGMEFSIMVFQWEW